MRAMGSGSAPIAPKILWFFVAMVVSLLICSYLPALSLWLPESLGLLK